MPGAPRDRGRGESREGSPSRGLHGRDAGGQIADRPDSPPQGLHGRTRRGQNPGSPAQGLGSGRSPGHGRPPTSASLDSLAGSGSGNRGIGPRPQQAPQSMRPVKKTWRDWRPSQISLRRSQVLTLGLVTALVILVAAAGVYRSRTAGTDTGSSGTITSSSTIDETTAPAVSALPLKGRMGAYTGTDVQTTRAFEDWWGQKLTYAVDFGGRDTWSDIADPANVLSEWKGSGYTLVLAVPMLPTELIPGWSPDDTSDATQNKKKAFMKRGGEGEYNQYFKQLAQNLVAAGQEKAVLRIGWEMNIETWMWGTDDTKDYKAFFQQIVKTMRSVDGEKFKFDFNVNNGFNPNPGEEYYPGDKYVDYVGVDTYDLDGNVYNAKYANSKKCDQACREEAQTTAWEEAIFGGPHGLGFWTDFAKQHDKPISLPEWACWDRFDGTGGADDPLFVEFMHDYITRPANNVAYANYFEYNSSQGEHNLQKSFPKAAKTFLKLFGKSAK
jgi:hypothetical protein